METTPYIIRQDIVNFPFPHKLWIVVHLESCDFLRWNRDGTVILLDLVALEYYLNSTRSIFKIKNRSVFLEHLDEFKFERLNVNPEAEEDLLLQYKNEYFQRHRLDLLAKIRRHTYQLIGEMPPDNNCVNGNGGSGTSGNNSVMMSNNEQTLAANNRVAERMLGDLSFMYHGGISNILSSRLRFQTVLNFQNETRLLQEKLQASNDHATQHRRGKSDLSAPRTTAGGSFTAEENNLIELPIDLFENPHDSVLHLEDNICPEYAGYYGNCSKEQITNFFGEYLPMYGDGTMEVKKFIAENSPTNNNLNSARESPNKTSHNVVSGILTSTPVSQNYSLANLNFSSESSNLNFSTGLEPIFKTEKQENINRKDEVYNVTQLNIDDEAEISMEEFIKFKNSSNESFVKATEMKEEYLELINSENGNEELYTKQAATTTGFPQMSADVKMEIEEDTVENEANFRNFFSQYRASLNLLYEHH